MPTAEATKPRTEEKKATWKDFTLEEHIRGFVGIPTGCLCRLKKVSDKHYRVNVIDVTNEQFTKSVFLKVIETPEGYIIEDLTNAGARKHLKDVL